jgi:flagella basal body P-ring formation protein FlgA
MRQHEKTNTFIRIGYKMNFGRIFSLLFLNILSFAVFSAQDPTIEINKSVTQYVTHWVNTVAKANKFRTTYDIGKIDPRLNLTPCAIPLEIHFQGDPLKQSRNTLSISCNSKTPWRVFTIANIQLSRDVLVTARSLARGTKITLNDIKIKEMPVNNLRYGYYVNPESLIGMQLKRNTQIETPFQPFMLITPKMINKGDDVVISAKSPYFSIKMKGRALMDGKLGQQISIRNLKSKRIIRGTVIAKGIVSVIL